VERFVIEGNILFQKDLKTYKAGGTLRNLEQGTPNNKEYNHVPSTSQKATEHFTDLGKLNFPMVVRF